MFRSGSDDAGRTVFTSDAKMNALCKKACGDFLNLKYAHSQVALLSLRIPLPLS